MKSDEQRLLDEFRARGGAPQRGAYLRDIGAELGIPPKRVIYLAEKWSEQGIYDYGVAADLGWLNDYVEEA